MAVVTATVDPSPTPQWIRVTADDSGVVQHYVVKRNDANSYMASNVTNNAGGGEGRFVAYTDYSLFTDHEDPSDLSGSNATIEGGDVFAEQTFNPDGTLASNITHSKFYGPWRMIDKFYHGVTGPGIGKFMFMGNRERSSGGPFFKDIDFQTGELYNYLFSGHT